MAWLEVFGFLSVDGRTCDGNGSVVLIKKKGENVFQFLYDDNYSCEGHTQNEIDKPMTWSEVYAMARNKVALELYVLNGNDINDSIWKSVTKHGPTMPEDSKLTPFMRL